MKFNDVTHYDYIEETSALFQALALRHVMLQEGRLDEAGIWDAVKGTVGGVMKGIKSANDAVDRLGRLAQQTKPVQAFDSKVDEIVANIKQKLGNKAPKAVAAAEKYAAWAKENPIKQALIIGALTAVAALASGPGAAAAAGFILRAANEYMKGEKASTAIGKGAKTAALGYGAAAVTGAVVKPLADMFAGIELAKVPYSVPGVTKFDIGQGYVLDMGGGNRISIAGNFLVPDADADYVKRLIDGVNKGDVGSFATLKKYMMHENPMGINAKEVVKKAVEAAGKNYLEAVANNPMLKLIKAASKTIPALAQAAVTAKPSVSSKFTDVQQQIQTMSAAERQKVIDYLKTQLATP